MITRRLAWAVAIAGAFTMTVSYIDRSMIGVLAPTVTAELDINDTEYGWISSAFSIAYLVGTPLAGLWIDRFGARRGLVLSVVAWSIVAALHSLAAGFAGLFMLRIALGLAESPGFPGAAQTVQRMLPPHDRSRGFGVLFTGSSIGFLVVPPLASWLNDEIGWRSTLLVSSAVALAWLPAWIALAFRRDVRAQLDDRPTVRGPTPWRLARDPRMLRALVAIFAAAPVTSFMYSWGSKLLVHDYKLAQGQVGHYLWLPAVCLDGGAILFGDLAVRTGRPRVLYAIAMTMAACFALVPLAGSPWQTTAVIGLATAGGGALYTLCTADLLAQMPARAVSFAGGVIACAQSLALIVMNPLVGDSVDTSGSYTGSAIAIGAWVLPGSLAWLLWRPSASASAT